MSTRRTFVRRVSIGRPISNVNEAASGVVSAQSRAAGNILINSASTNLYQSGDLVGSHGIVKFFDSSGNNIVLSVDSDELKAIIDSDYVKFITGQSLTRNFVDSAYVEQNSLDSERGLNLFNAELGQLSVSIIPQSDSAIDLGDSSKKFRTLYLSGNTIHLGGLIIGDESTKLAIRDSAGVIAAFDLGGNTTTDLAEGTNLYYTRARFDSALGDTTSRGTIRGYLNLVDAGGDGSLTYDSASGKLTYTGPSASEVRAHMNVIDAGGDGSFTYDSALGKFTYTGPSAAEVRNHFTGGHGIVLTSGTGNISVDSSEIRGLFSAGGDLTYNSGTGQFTFDVESVYTQANFESDLSLSLNATNGIAYDSARHKLSLINTGVAAATYGSSTRVPILKIQADGRVDSAGSVLVAGVTGFALDSASGVLTISTADGGSFSAPIHSRDSAELFEISGSSLNYDSGSVNQFTATNITADSAVITDISGTSVNVTTGLISQLSADSARATNFTAATSTLDSARAKSISGTSLNYTTAHLANISSDSAKVGNMTITGDLTVSGTQTTINTQTVKVHDPIIHLADSNETSDIVDLGFIGKYYRDGQQRHTGLVRDASNEQYYLFRDVVDSSLDSSLTINRSATGFAKADLNVANLLADSATMTNLTVTGLSTTTMARAATVDSGTYGSSTRIPRITVNTSGFIDSIGEVLVAGVTAFALDSASGVLTISTADGGSFSAPIHSRDSAELFEISGSSINYDSGSINVFTATTIAGDSASIFDISGSSLNYDSGSVNQFTATNITADSAVITDISGTSVNYTTGLISQLSADSASLTTIDNNVLRTNDLNADSAVITDISGTSVNYTSGLISQLSVDSGYITNLGGKIAHINGVSGDSASFTNLIASDTLTVGGKLIPIYIDSAYIEQNSLDSERTISLIDSSYVGERARTITAPEIKYINTDAGAGLGPRIVLDRNSSSPADSDALGYLEFRGRNSSDSDMEYASIRASTQDVTKDTEDGELQFHLKQAGFDREKFALTPRGFELGTNERLYFQGDSGDLYLHSDPTSSHNLLLPDSSGTLLTRSFVFELIDSAYIGARQSATGLTLDFDDSAGATKVSLTITQAATITTGAPIGFGNTVTLLDKDSAEVTISL